MRSVVGTPSKRARTAPPSPRVSISSRPRPAVVSLAESVPTSTEVSTEPVDESPAVEPPEDFGDSTIISARGTRETYPIGRTVRVIYWKRINSRSVEARAWTADVTSRSLRLLGRHCHTYSTFSRSLVPSMPSVGSCSLLPFSGLPMCSRSSLNGRLDSSPSIGTNADYTLYIGHGVIDRDGVGSERTAEYSACV